MKDSRGSALVRLAIGLVAVIVGLCGVPMAAAAVPVSHVVTTYTYDAPCNDSAQERGSPVGAHVHTAYDAAALCLPGASAHPDWHSAPATTTDADAATLVQAPPVTAGSRVVATDWDLSPFQRLEAAAKTVDNLPTVNWGQQSKHFPGHPNYISGKSQLTANPEALIQRAGTGTPVGSVSRGQPGFKERIDFGDRIGTWISRDGASSSPTSVGILHYRADGSVHIIPGRPS